MNATVKITEDSVPRNSTSTVRDWASVDIDLKHAHDAYQGCFGNGLAPVYSLEWKPHCRAVKSRCSRVESETYDLIYPDGPKGGS